MLSGYGVPMASHAELPELPANAALVAYLRRQAEPPDGPGDYTLGEWQLHTHPDLISRLRLLAPDWPVTAAYGVPLLASEGVAAVVAIGMDSLAVRIDELPPEIQADDRGTPWSSAAERWKFIDAWQNDRALRDLVSIALTRAASLALPKPEQGDGASRLDVPVPGVRLNGTDPS
jgi:hypothetical protein